MKLEWNTPIKIITAVIIISIIIIIITAIDRNEEPINARAIEQCLNSTRTYHAEIDYDLRDYCVEEYCEEYCEEFNYTIKDSNKYDPVKKETIDYAEINECQKTCENSIYNDYSNLEPKNKNLSFGYEIGCVREYPYEEETITCHDNETMEAEQ